MTEPTRPTPPPPPEGQAAPTAPMPVTPGPQGGPGGPGGPRRPGLWRQATSTTGGLIAVVVAAALAALLVLGLLGLTGIVAARAIGSHHGPGSVTQLREGRGDGLPPGQQRRLDRQMPGMPGPQGNQWGGNGDGNGNGGGGGGQGLGGLLGGRGGLAGLGNVQHGELTVQQNGKPLVLTVQRGAVTSVSATSLAVKSDDGFTATYALDSTTRRPAGLTKDDVVVVVAQKSGAKAVLVRVLG